MISLFHAGADAQPTFSATRSALGLADSSRADLRFSFAINERIFVTNEHDGTLRLLTDAPEPGYSLVLVFGPVVAACRRRV